MAAVVFADAFTIYTTISHLTSFFFLLAALWSDLLLIRVWLVLAHIFLLVSWLWNEPQVIFLDMAIWTTVTMFFHGFAVYRHLTDEVQRSFADKFEEQVFSFFNRRCGMHKQEFFMIMREAERCTIGKGQVIMTEGSNMFYLHLLVQGVVKYTVGNDTAPYQYRSGDLFNTEIGNVFGVHLGFSESLRAWAETDCILVRWPYAAVVAMSRMSPSVGGYWRNLLLFTMGQRLRRREHLADDMLAEGTGARGLMELIASVDSHGVPEDESWLTGGRSRDFTKEYEEEEKAYEANSTGQTLKGGWSWFWSSFGPFPPPGVRHYTLPEVAKHADRDGDSRTKIVRKVTKSLEQVGRAEERAQRNSSNGWGLLDDTFAAIARRRKGSNSSWGGFFEDAIGSIAGRRGSTNGART